MYPSINGLWGGKCWVVYNKALVKRVMLLFSLDCLDCWYDEVRSMNVGKVVLLSSISLDVQMNAYLEIGLLTKPLDLKRFTFTAEIVLKI